MVNPVSFELPGERARPSTLDADERLFRHKKRPNWGVGLWVREEANRRRLRFEDGELRAFRKGYYHLLEPVDSASVDVDAMVERLADDHEVAAEEAHRAKEAKPPVMSFEQQIQVFTHLFPKGFSDPEYLSAYRSADAGKEAKKRHIDPVIAQAAGALEKAALEAATPTEVYDTAVSLLAQTALVTPSALQPLRNLPAGDHPAFAKALIDLLHGEERYRTRFDNWLSTLANMVPGDVHWALATALPALYQPERHVVIKPSSFSLQARSLAPGKRVKKTLNSRGYRRGRRVALKAFKLLDEAGQEPRDLFDAYAFMWETLRPKGQKLLESLEAA